MFVKREKLDFKKNLIFELFLTLESQLFTSVLIQSYSEKIFEMFSKKASDRAKLSLKKY